MKKLIIALLFMVGTAHAQVTSTTLAEETIIEDTVKPKPQKVVILQGSKEGFEMLSEVLRQSPLVFRGKALSFDETLQLLQWVNSRIEVEVPKKETPKK